MFGGFGSTVYSAYHEIIPETKGIQKRIQLYKLFHYLNHRSVFYFHLFHVLNYLIFYLQISFNQFSLNMAHLSFFKIPPCHLLVFSLMLAIMNEILRYQKSVFMIHS